MVLSCLWGYHLRCLRPSLLPDSQPLVERDEIIVVSQNSLSLSFSLRLSLPVPVPRAAFPFVFLKTCSERIIIATVGFAFVLLGAISDAFFNKERASQTNARRRTVIPINIHKAGKMECVHELLSRLVLADSLASTRSIIARYNCNCLGRRDFARRF